MTNRAAGRPKPPGERPVGAISLDGAVGLHHVDGGGRRGVGAKKGDPVRAGALLGAEGTEWEGQGPATIFEPVGSTCVIQFLEYPEDS